MINAVSVFAMPFMIGGIVLFGVFRRIDVYDSFALLSDYLELSFTLSLLCFFTIELAAFVRT